MPVWHIFLTVLAFGIFIFVHELGHFLAALRVGVRVEKFFVGFDFWGLKLFSMRRGGTEYGIGVFPLGGYVKLAGQEDFGKARTEGKPDEFTSKTIWERVFILVAGVFFNFVSAFAFAWMAYGLGYRMVVPLVGMVVPGSAAWESGLREDDRILSYNGIAISSFSDIQLEVALGGSDRSSIVLVERKGESGPLEIPVTPRKNSQGIPMLGIVPTYSLAVEAVEVDSPAHKAGLLPGDLVLEAGGKKLEKWEELQKLVEEHGDRGKALSLTVERGKTSKSVEVIPAVRKKGLLGIKPRSEYLVEGIMPASRAEKAGIRRGERLLTAGGLELAAASEDDLKKLSASSLTLVFADSSGKSREVEYPASWPELGKELHFDRKIPKVIIQETVAGSAAERMGLVKGDEISNLEIEKVCSIKSVKWEQLVEAVSGSAGKSVRLELVRDGKPVELKGTIGESADVDYHLGLSHAPAKMDCGWQGASLWPFHMLRTTYRSLWALLTAKISTDQLSGPLGILKTTYLVSKAGLETFMYWMALISINLAFINILPIPVLDGGHVLFCAVEGIKGRPLSEAFMTKLQYVGLSLILMLLVFATRNDIYRYLDIF